jgi:hypothetical protein
LYFFYLISHSYTSKKEGANHLAPPNKLYSLSTWNS